MCVCVRVCACVRACVCVRVRACVRRAGLRSLSPTAPGGGPDLVYGTQEDYWRGKVRDRHVTGT